MPPSRPFYILANYLSYLLDDNPEVAILAKGVEKCRKLHPAFKRVKCGFSSEIESIPAGCVESNCGYTGFDKR